jgi:hypothetical protein
MPMVNDPLQIKFTTYQNNVCGVPQTTTNANNSLNMQNGYSAHALNHLLARTNGNPPGLYMPT